MSLNLDRQITLWRHAALKTRGEEDVLVLPERAIRLGGSGGEILRLCNDERTGRDIVATMQARYPDAHQIDAEVVAFLAEMVALGGLVAAPPEAGEQSR
jgi:pyrroloquinoline quinone biosynthesis protein D